MITFELLELQNQTIQKEMSLTLKGGIFETPYK